MTASSLVIALRECARPLPAANIVNRTSVAVRARTAFRLVARLPAPPSLSSSFATARCAFTPTACASVIALRECGWPLPTANIVNRASVASRARTAFHRVTSSRAVPSVSSPLTAARCAFIPRDCALFVHALIDGGRRYINSLPRLRHRTSGRRLLHQHRSECRPSAYITDPGPNPAVERPCRRGRLRSFARSCRRPAAQLMRYVAFHE